MSGAKQDWEDKYSRTWDAHRRQNQIITEDAAKVLPPPFLDVLHRGRAILEIGCGTGELSNWLAHETGARLLGVDLSQTAISAARRLYSPPCEFQAVSYRDLFATPRRFDLVVSSHTLEHFKNYEEVLHEWLQLAPLVLLIVPYKQEIDAAEYEEGGLQHRSSLDETALKSFRILESFTFPSDGWQVGDNPLNWVVLLSEAE